MSRSTEKAGRERARLSLRYGKRVGRSRGQMYSMHTARLERIRVRRACEDVVCLHRFPELEAMCCERRRIEPGLRLAW